MGSDMVVALGRATADGCTHFGQNVARTAGESLFLHRAAGREFAPGESVQTQYLRIPQARQTFTAVGCRPPQRWGYYHGLNEHGVAAGCVGFRNKLQPSRPGLTGTDLVRLVLERSRAARQALDVLAELLERHGAGAPRDTAADEGDHAILIADGAEAFVVETAAGHWVCQEVLEVRAVSNVCTIRQDWDHISRGLAGLAIGQGWWPADGSKLDFAEALSDSPTGEASALRRWGRATLLLEQQNGRIDAGLLRRLLGDHYEGTHFEVDPFARRPVPLPICQHAPDRGTGASLIAHTAAGTDRLRYLECAFGPPCQTVYMPVFLEGDLPPAFTADLSPVLAGPALDAPADRLYADPATRVELRTRLLRLQADLDQEAEEFAAEGAALRDQGDLARLRQSATEFMQRGVDQFRALLAELPAAPAPRPPWHPVRAGR